MAEATAINGAQPVGWTPDYLAIGHVTRDLLPDGSWRLGGTVTFAALTATRLGLGTAIVTSAPADVAHALTSALPGVPAVIVPCVEATTYENIYDGTLRRQVLRGCAAPLALADVPPTWRAATIVHLAPLAQEVAAELASAFPHSLVAATPQGWLRRWDEAGIVGPGPLAHADAILPHLRALILSREDLFTRDADRDSPQVIAAADAQIAAWAGTVPLVAVTRGARGALLLRGGRQADFPAYPVREVDPTGAGDVFAAAFLVKLHQTGDPETAIDFANRVAALSVERIGIAGIPSPEQVAARFGSQ